MIDALVLGAGASGLRAGSELVRKRVSVLVLEARDRVGAASTASRIASWGASSSSARSSCMDHSAS